MFRRSRLVLLPALSLLAACGSSTATPTTTPVPTPAILNFAMAINGKTMTPAATIKAVKGRTIKLTFTTDKDEEVHLHGFDRMFTCKAGRPQSQTFVADRTGAFEIEIETTSTHIGELDINPA